MTTPEREIMHDLMNALTIAQGMSKSAEKLCKVEYDPDLLSRLQKSMKAIDRAIEHARQLREIIRERS